MQDHHSARLLQGGITDYLMKQRRRLGWASRATAAPDPRLVRPLRPAQSRRVDEVLREHLRDVNLVGDLYRE